MPKNTKPTTSPKQKSSTTPTSKVSDGFVTPDEMYAAVPFGKRFMIIHNGQQLGDVKTIAQAHKFIKQHRANPESGTVFV